MQRNKITASTLEALLYSVAAANREWPAQGTHLFIKILERIELARSGTVDKPAD